MSLERNPSEDTTLARRDFLGTTAAALGGLGLGACAGSVVGEHGEHGGHGEHGEHDEHDGHGEHDGHDEDREHSLLSAGDVVLFQGDSITDAGRSRERAGEANVQAALGGGYAWFAAGGLLTAHADLDLKIYNRGISGNKVFQLADRWQQDCLDLKPDLLSILIGVNDIWHSRGGNYDGTVETYERDYQALVERTRAALPEVKLVICEPFVLRCGAIDDSWFPEFDTYRAAARQVAEASGARWVPFQAAFDEAVGLAPPQHWAGDGVHPSAAGAALMAQTWRGAVGA